MNMLKRKTGGSVISLHTSFEVATFHLLQKIASEIASDEREMTFSSFSCMFLNPNNFSNLNSNCSDLLDLTNIQEQVKKVFCYQKLF